jgi:RNA recognition motif-containing protein
MLERHFSAVKTVHGIKLPTTKFHENKGFAFIYFGSEDDASIVKRELDRSVILKDKIRVTKTVVAENLSKMIFKLKASGLNDKQIEDVEKTFFNDEALEK